MLPSLHWRASFVNDVAFGGVGHQTAMVLAWTVHDLVELVMAALFLLVASALALALAILLRYPGWPGPVRGNLDSLVEMPGVNGRKSYVKEVLPTEHIEVLFSLAVHVVG